MNILLPTPDELKDFQLKHYTNLMKDPRSFEHKIFLRKQIFQLKKQSNGDDRNYQNHTAIHRGRRNSNECRRHSSLPVFLQGPYD